MRASILSNDTMLVVRHALMLGWEPCERNRAAVKHFYFDHKADLPQFAVYVLNYSETLFTVGNETTTVSAHAIEWLDKAAKGGK